MPRGFKRLSKEERIAAAQRGGAAPKRKPAGFAAMTPERRRALGSKGGKRSAEVRRNGIIKTNDDKQTDTQKLSSDVSDNSNI